MKNIIIIFLLFIFIIWVAYYKEQQKEPFTPAINRIYRPHARNARIYVTNKFSDVTKQITSIIRKTV
jgi:hypothetical protein